MTLSTNDIQINKTYYFVLSKNGRAKKGKVLGYVKFFGEVWIYFQILEKNWGSPISNFALNEIGIGETRKDAKESFSKITYGNKKFLYDTEAQLYLNLKIIGEISKGYPEYINSE